MIEAHDLRFGYDEEAIIDDLTFEFESGAITAVTGPSGRGKSTLLYLVGLLLTPWSGHVRIAGEAAVGLSDLERSRLRARLVGFVFQDAALDPARTVLDNIVEPAVYANEPRDAAADRARALMSQFGVELREDHRPGEISGGQAQRVALCRALINHPEVILADEPTGNLDVDTASVVLDALREEADRGRTVIVASHDRAVVDRGDHVLAL